MVILITNISSRLDEKHFFRTIFLILAWKEYLFSTLDISIMLDATILHLLPYTFPSHNPSKQRNCSRIDHPFYAILNGIKNTLLISSPITITFSKISKPLKLAFFTKIPATFSLPPFEVEFFHCLLKSLHICIQKHFYQWNWNLLMFFVLWLCFFSCWLISSCQSLFDVILSFLLLLSSFLLSFYLQHTQKKYFSYREMNSET